MHTFWPKCTKCTKSIYIIYIAPLHRLLHHIRSALQYSLVQGLSVFHSFVRRSHLLPDQHHGSCIPHFCLSMTTWGKHSMSQHSPYCTWGNTQCLSIHLIAPPPTTLQSGRSMVVGHVLMVHTCSLMCTQSYRHDSTHLGHFTSLGSTPIIQTSIMQAEDGGFFFKLFYFFSKTFY